MVVKVLRWVVVQVLAGHPRFEIRIPSRWKDHVASKAGVGLSIERPLQRADYSVRPTDHAIETQHPAAEPRTPEVDRVKRTSCGVKSRRESPLYSLRRSAHDGEQKAQVSRDEIAEHHVEEELAVGPPGAVRRPAQVGWRALGNECTKLGASSIEFVADVASAWRITHRLIFPWLSSVGMQRLSRVARLQGCHSRRKTGESRTWVGRQHARSRSRWRRARSR